MTGFSWIIIAFVAIRIVTSIAKKNGGFKFDLKVGDEDQSPLPPILLKSSQPKPGQYSTGQSILNQPSPNLQTYRNKRQELPGFSGSQGTRALEEFLRQPSLKKIVELSLKDKELLDSGGKEGEWGDEGRSSAEIMGTEGTQGSEGQAGVEGRGSDFSGLGISESVTASEKAFSIKASSQTSTGLTELYQPSMLGYSPNELVQGVIWSEILSKPRAMRPHRGPRS